MFAYCAERDLFVQDVFAGADPRYQMPVRVITELAWHSLFARTLFIDKDEEAAKHAPEFTVVDIPSFRADPELAAERRNSKER